MLLPIGIAIPAVSIQVKFRPLPPGRAVKGISPP